jgi:hypothetical protein
MAWTDADEARYQANLAHLGSLPSATATAPPPEQEGLAGRALKTIANLPGQIVGGVGEGILQLLQMGQPEDVRSHINIPNIFDITPDQTPGFTGAKAIDYAGGIANQVGQFALPAGAISKAGKAIGFGGKMLSALDWGIPSAISAAQHERDPGVIATHALTGAVMGPLFGLPAKAAVPALLGASTVGGGIAGYQKGDVLAGAEEGFMSGLLPAGIKGVGAALGRFRPADPALDLTATNEPATGVRSVTPTPIGERNIGTYGPPEPFGPPDPGFKLEGDGPFVPAQIGEVGGEAAPTTPVGREQLEMWFGEHKGWRQQGPNMLKPTGEVDVEYEMLKHQLAEQEAAARKFTNLTGRNPEVKSAAESAEIMARGEDFFLGEGSGPHLPPIMESPAPRSFSLEAEVEGEAQHDLFGSGIRQEAGPIESPFVDPNQRNMRFQPTNMPAGRMTGAGLKRRLGVPTDEFSLSEGSGPYVPPEPMLRPPEPVDPTGTGLMNFFGGGKEGLELPAPTAPRFDASGRVISMPAKRLFKEPFRLQEGTGPFVPAQIGEEMGAGGGAADAAAADPAQRNLQFKPVPKPLKMTTPMQTGDQAMLKTAAKRLNLTYNGVQSGVHPRHGRLTDDLHYFTLNEKGMETTISVKEGATYAELKAAKTQALKEMKAHEAARAATEAPPPTAPQPDPTRPLDFKKEPVAAPALEPLPQPTSALPVAKATEVVPAQIPARQTAIIPSSSPKAATDMSDVELHAAIKEANERMSAGRNTFSREEKYTLKKKIAALKEERDARADREEEIVPAQNAKADDDFDADAFLKSILNDPALEEASRNAANPLRRTASEAEEEGFKEGIRAIREFEAEPTSLTSAQAGDLQRARETSFGESMAEKIRARRAEKGSVDAELLARYFAPSFVGGAVGAANDPDNRLRGAVIGAGLGFAAGAMGPGVFRALMKSGGKASADVKLAAKLKKTHALSWSEMGAGDANHMSENYVERFARGLQKYGQVMDDVRDVLGRSNVHLELETLDNAFENLKRLAGNLNPAELKRTLEYLREPPSAAGTARFARDMSAHPDWAKHTTVSKETFAQLQRVIVPALKKGEAQATIYKNMGMYLTDAFRIFSDKTYRASAGTVQSMVDELSRWQIFPGYGEVANRKMVEQYLGDIYKNRAMYKGSKTTEGQTLDNILRMKKKLDKKLQSDLLTHTGAKSVDEIVTNNLPLTPELKTKLQTAIREGEYLTPAFRMALGQFESPVELIAATGLKLLAGARTAKLLSFVDNSTLEGNIKMAYAPEEIDAVINTIKTKIAGGLAGPELRVARKAIHELSNRQQLPIDEGLGVLSGKLVPAQVGDHLPGMVDGLFGDHMGSIMQGVMEAHRFMKVGATAMNPISHVRQIISTPVLAALADTSPMDLARAIPVVRGINAAERTRQFQLGILGADFSTAEFGKTGRQMLTGDRPGLMDKFLQTPGIKNMIDLYHYPDAVLRSATFTAAERRFKAKLKEDIRSGKRAAMTPDEIQAEVETKAIRHTNRYTMNYENIPHGVKELRKMPFVNLFISYQFEMSRILKNLTVDAIKDRNIGAIAKLGLVATIPEILQHMSEASLSPEDRKAWEQSKNLSPAYSRARFKMGISRDKDGNFHYIDFSPLVPTDDLARTLRSTVSGDWKGFLANNPLAGTDKTPVLNVAAEIVTGRSNRTGRDINTVGRAFDAARQEFAPSLFGGFEFDRIMQALQSNESGGHGITRIPAGTKVTPQEEAFTFATGLRKGTVNPQWQQHSAMTAAQAQVRQERLYLNDTLRSDVTPDVKQRAIERYKQAIMMIAADTRSKLGVQTPGF